MANYYASARSNYFRVKDAEAFKHWATATSVKIITSEGDGMLYGLLGGEDGGWPCSIFNEETDEYEDFDITASLAPHLAEGEVAVLMEVGAEKLRYLNGWAVAVNSNGDEITLNLNEIYERAQALGPNITLAEY